jgi:uncharacterized protein YndB with AHSA1/START domain
MTTKLMEEKISQEIIITRAFDAPRTFVFKTWTDPKHLAQWWGPRGFTNPVCEWDTRPGKKIYIVMRAPNGVRYPMSGEFREVVAPERLVFTSGALDEKGNLLFEFLHTVTFVERNGKTTLTIQSRIVKTTPEAVKYISGFEAGMTQSLEKLAGHLATYEEPLVIERTFNAPIALVWKALTSKKDMAQWYFDLNEFKPEAGFEFQFSAEDKGVKYLHHCKVTEMIPCKKLAYSWRYEGYAGNSLVIFELFAEGDQTRLKLTHEGLETFPKIPAFARANFTQGWTSLLGESLKQFVELKTTRNNMCKINN